MIDIRAKKGWELPVSGMPASHCTEPAQPSHIAVLPIRIPHIRPRLLVTEGDEVKRGGVLFFDKRKPEVRFLSPGGGKITRIKFGKRRVIEEIIIALAEDEPIEPLTRLKPEEFTKPGRIQKALILNGLWPLLRGLPYRDYADPRTEPSTIYVRLGCASGWRPRPDIYLAGREDLFIQGIELLKALCPDIIVYLAGENDVPEKIRPLITHRIRGPYPAGDPGVFLYHTRKSSRDNSAWYIDGQDLLRMTESVLTGIFPVDRVYTVGGDVGSPGHVRSRIGAPISLLTGLPAGTHGKRCITGHFMNGFSNPADGYIGMMECSVIVVDEGSEPDFLGFMRPGIKAPTFSRTFFSALTRPVFRPNASTHGELRACVNCGSCMRVCPVDILPQFTYKAIVTDQIEEALEHGLLDCVGCGLCTFVCPSKIELTRTFLSAVSEYHKEQEPS